MTRTKPAQLNAKNRASLERKIGRKLSDAEFKPFKYRKWNMPGQGASADLHYYGRCKKVMMQETITDEDIAACQEVNDSDREKVRMHKRGVAPRVMTDVACAVQVTSCN